MLLLNMPEVPVATFEPKRRFFLAIRCCIDYDSVKQVVRTGVTMGQNYKHFTDGSIQRKLADIHWKAVLCVFLSKTHENVKKLGSKA